MVFDKSGRPLSSTLKRQTDCKHFSPQASPTHFHHHPSSRQRQEYGSTGRWADSPLLDFLVPTFHPASSVISLDPKSEEVIVLPHVLQGLLISLLIKSKVFTVRHKVLPGSRPQFPFLFSLPLLTQFKSRCGLPQTHQGHSCLGILHQPSVCLQHSSSGFPHGPVPAFPQISALNRASFFNFRTEIVLPATLVILLPSITITCYVPFLSLFSVSPTNT